MKTEKLPKVFEIEEGREICSPKWTEGFGPERLLAATVYELIDGVTVYVRQGLWLVRSEGGLKNIPLSYAGLPFFEGLRNWLEGWGPVDGEPKDQLDDGDYELTGPDVKGNPYNNAMFILIPHNVPYPTEVLPKLNADDDVKTWWKEYAKFFINAHIEGLVWWENGEPVVTLRRSDFGLPWPVKQPGS